MKNILVVSGHTDLNDSVANKNILEELKKLLPNAEIDLLSELYPSYKIDVKKEQEKLVNADIIVLQYPLFWYSMPSILEKWMEDTFIFGFSHGDGGDKLKGKKLIVSLTTGAPEENYIDEKLGYDIEEYLHPIKKSCRMCQLEYCGVVKTYGVSYHIRQDKGNEIIEKAKKHALALVDMINKI